jgi:hypothetical protein
MPEITLLDAIALAYPEALRADVKSELIELESEGFIVPDRDDLTRVVSWTLTSKGKHAVKQIA